MGQTLDRLSNRFFHFIFLPCINSLLGQRNLVYLLFMLAVWYATGVYEIFFAFTSYVHYFRYTLYFSL